MKTSLFLFFVCILFSCGQSSNVNENNASTHSEKDENHGLPKNITDLGSKVFLTTCASCHNDSTKMAAPSPTLLAGMSPRAVLSALTIGKMKFQGEKLSTEEREAVSQWLTNKELKDNVIPNEVYTTFLLPPDHDKTFDHSGWGGNLEGTGYRTEAQSGITSANVGSLQLKWTFAFPDASQVRCKPAVVGEWLIVGSQFGEVYAINMKTGKPAWKFNASAAIRGAIFVTEKGEKITAFFADYSTNVYSIDVRTGTLLWQTRSGFHPQSSVTGSVTVFDNKVFVPITSLEVFSARNPDYDCCTSSGGVVAMDAESGKIIWTYKVISDEPKVTGKKKNGKDFYGPSGAIVWSSPTVDQKEDCFTLGPEKTIPLLPLTRAMQFKPLI